MKTVTCGVRHHRFTRSARIGLAVTVLTCQALGWQGAQAEEASASVGARAGTTGPSNVSGDPSRPGDLRATILDVNGDILDLAVGTESLDGSIGVQESGPRTTVTLATDVLFAFGKADLTPAARARIAQAADELRRAQAMGAVVVSGHTDHVGTGAYNQSLSLRRAQAVVAALQPAVSGLGVTLTAQGHGYTRPLVSEKTPTGADDPAARARNRRVELTFSGIKK